MKRLLCLVTDRRRLAAALGRSEHDARTTLLDQIRGAVAGGIDLVQIRENDLEAGALARLVDDALGIAKGTSARIVVNDRLDVAIAAGADGVHLREASFSASAARQLAPGLLVGCSVHSPQRAALAGPVDYLIAGTVFPTPSKLLETALIGAEGLADIVRAAAGTPVLGIGGVSGEHARLLIEAGAVGFAAIGAFIPDSVSRDVGDAVQKIVQNCRFAFDTASAVP